MVSTRNTSRSNANPPRMQDPPGDADSRPPRTVEAMRANTNEVEALRLVNQHLIEELEQLTRQIQHPRETRQTQEGHNIPLHEGRSRGAKAEAESSQARGHGPQLAPAEEENEAVLGGHIGNEEPHHPSLGTEEQSWEHRFRSLQQKLGCVKEVVKGSAPDTMDTLVQQTESPFTAEVLRSIRFQQNSECHKWKHSMESKIPSTTSILTRIKWSCTDIKTLYGAGLSPLH